MKEIFAVILVSNGDVFFKVPSLNVLDQSILGFCHSVPNLRIRLMILESSFTVKPCCSIGCMQYFSLNNTYMNIKEGHQKKGKINEDVHRDGIPSRILVHLNLAHLVVGNGNEVFEIFKIHFSKGSNAKQFGREVVLDMVVLHGLKKQTNENKRNKETGARINKYGNDNQTHQLMSFMAFKTTAVQYLGSTTI